MKTYNESVEDQIARIERLLADQAPLVEDVDVRLYKMEVLMQKSPPTEPLKQNNFKINLEALRMLQLSQRETLLKHSEAKRLVFSIKFEFLGSNPEEFAAKQLIPAMNAIQGVEVINKPGVGWSVPNEVTPGKKLSEIDTLQEYGFGGGVVSNLGAQRYTSGHKMATPDHNCRTILDDWVEGGVMAYDAPTNTTDMRYHVMLPVEELFPYMSRGVSRRRSRVQGRYQHVHQKRSTSAGLFGDWNERKNQGYRQRRFTLVC